jgi:hypothetical protein
MRFYYFMEQMERGVSKNLPELVRKGRSMEFERKQEHTSVAWYKLADLITRKEREKALNVYRLLSHSLEDRAYALQLEGDILWALADDRAASEKYRQAAFLYRKEKRLINAIAICEHLVFLEKNKSELLVLLLELYAMMRWEERFLQRLATVMQLYNQRVMSDDQLLHAIKEIMQYVHGLELREEGDWIYKAFLGVAETCSEQLSEKIKECLRISQK